MKARPALQRGMSLGEDWKRSELTDDAARKVLFGQTAETLRSAGKKPAG